MENFIRTQNLIGEKSMQKLCKSRVLIFGVGGVGGYVAEGLARSGVGNIALVDFDDIAESNINRQIIAGYSTVGQKKVEVMKKRILDINPKAVVQIFDIKFNEETKDQINFGDYDYVVDAIDMITSKLIIVELAKQNNTPIISCMGTGNKLDVTKLQICDISKTYMCPLAKVMRKLLKDRGINHLDVLFSTEEPQKTNNEYNGKAVPNSIVFVPAVAGLTIASFVVNKLTNS